MQEYIKWNIYRYLAMDKNKYRVLWIVPLCLFLLLLFYAYKKDAYDVIEITGQTICQEQCTIEFFYPATAFYGDFVKINREKYEIETISFSEPILDSNNQAIQNISLKLKKYSGTPNAFVTMQVYKNKERLLKKIARIMKER